MSTCFIHALHGFLGLPTDWDFLRPAMPLLAADLFADFSPKEGLEAFGHAFNLQIEKANRKFVSYCARPGNANLDWLRLCQIDPPHHLPPRGRASSFGMQSFNLATSLESPKLYFPAVRSIAGYSLGGRLALHALIESPTLWNAALIVSAHPGLESVEERKERCLQDQLWASRVVDEPWEEFLRAWNKQPVFKGSPYPRKEGGFNRETLAEALFFWSLGHQKDLREAIAQLPMPILWVVGERDSKFLQLAEGLSFKHPLSRVLSMPESGHRVLFDAPLALDRAFQEFLAQVLGA